MSVAISDVVPWSSLEQVFLTGRIDASDPRL